MSPTDKDEVTTNPDIKEDGQSQRSLTSEMINESVGETASCSATDKNLPNHGAITSIPMVTANASTLKCSINDQMKTFDPGEDSKNSQNKHSGYVSTFPSKNSISVTKNKNYKAGSKINKLADMLAKRSQNIVEMTQNVSSDVVADIISVPKVESICNAVEVSDNIEAEEKLEFSRVLCEKTVNNFEVDSIHPSPNKSVPNENNKNNVEELESQSDGNCCSDVSEILSHDGIALSEFNALKEYLIKPETDTSTKSKKEIRKNLKNVELSLILPEKKRRSSLRKKMISCETIKECYDSCKEDQQKVKTSTIEEVTDCNSLNDQRKSHMNISNVNKTTKTKSGRQCKSRKLVETSTQTVTTDFIRTEGAESEKSAQLESNTNEEDVANSESIKLESDTTVDPAEDTEYSGSSESAPKMEIELVTDSGSKSDSEIKLLGETSKETEKCVYACLYCTESFVSKKACKYHEKYHSPKKRKQVTKCQYCTKRFPSVYDLKLHCIKNHPNKYAYCVKCDERFCEKNQLYSHNKLYHLTKAMEEALLYVKLQETLGINPREKRKEDEKVEEVKKPADKKTVKPVTSKPDLKVDVSFDTMKKSSVSPRAAPRVSPRDNKTEEQLLEMEMLFYSHLSGNIKENLANHLDGKIDKNGNPIQADMAAETSESNQAKPKSNNLLSVVTVSVSGTSADQIARAPSPYQTRSKTPNPLPPTAKKFNKLPNWQQKFWEKYNFPTNYRYEHRFWDKNYLDTEKSAFYLKDLSCLDIKTQLIMRENIKKLDTIKFNDENNKSSDKMTFPEYLSLVPRVFDGSGQDAGGENLDCSKGKVQIFDEVINTQKSTNPDAGKLRRKTSADNCVIKRQPEKNVPKPSDGVKMLTRRQSVIELGKVSKRIDDMSKKRKGSLDITGSQKVTLRRQTSLDNLQKIYGSENNSKMDKPISSETAELNSTNVQSEGNPSPSYIGTAEISGEWVRPRIYLCGTCCAKFTNLWELEDHKWVNHPNVWCTHYEFEDEKIDKLFHRSDTEAGDGSGSAENPPPPPLSKLKLTDLYKRYLLPHGSLKTAKLVPNMSFPEQCTKCKKNCMNSSEMHKHMLDCGGDTTWFLTMYSSPMTIKRKWRPFGSRRKKQIGRRMVKRNIPNTPNIRPYHYQHRIRTKPGDVETIQKMLANLPEKRARRAINFDEIKTRSQATIHSNRLLRKRFKVSFGTNIMRLKALKQQRQVKAPKKESSSKSATDTSSENTPTGSPKRKNKLKDGPQLIKEENVFEETTRESGLEENKCSKKKLIKQRKKKESLNLREVVKKQTKKENRNDNSNSCKPMTRSNSTGSSETLKDPPSRDKKKGQVKKVESVLSAESQNSNQLDGKDNIKKTLKDIKHVKSHKKRSEKQELIHSDTSGLIFSLKTDDDDDEDDGDGNKRKKVKTEIKQETLVIGSENEDAARARSHTKRRKGANLSNKNILRLKTNDKEKTELIKRIRKTLRNSKRILEKRENKDKYERRRSLRIKILQSADVAAPDEGLSCDKMNKDIKQTISEIRPARSPHSSVERVDSPSVKKSSKIGKNAKDLNNSTIFGRNGHGDKTNRRSTRIMSATLTDEKYNPPLDNNSTNVPEENIASDSRRRTSKLISDGYDVITRPQHAGSVMKSSPNDFSGNSSVSEDNPSPLVACEFESLKKTVRMQDSKTSKDTTEVAQSGKSSYATKAVRRFVVDEAPKKSGDAIDNRSGDLSEMPVLDKEEPVRGRMNHKNETEIPILMPFENETEESYYPREGNSGKRKGTGAGKVVKRRRNSLEKLIPSKSLKESDSTNLDRRLIQPNEKNKREKIPSEENDNLEGIMKKRKKNIVNESVSGKDRLPKTPKTKKYFLGICPNEIDKGGDSKEDSGSDSEPLITLVLNQKSKEKDVNISTFISKCPAPEASVAKSSTKKLCTAKQHNFDSTFSDVNEPEITVSCEDECEKAAIPEAETDASVIEAKTEHDEILISQEDTKDLGNLSDAKFENLERKNEIFHVTEEFESVGGVLENENVTGHDVQMKKKSTKRSSKGIKMTVKLKKATLNIVESSLPSPVENKWSAKAGELTQEVPVPNENENGDESPNHVAGASVNETKGERRSRRISKEVKSTNEFIIDDPLILVDELWSDLDSDSDGSRKRSKKGKKKATKKKFSDAKRGSSVNLEELLRNFGEGKNSKEVTEKPPRTKYRKRRKPILNHIDKRKQLENCFRSEAKLYRRLSLRLFKFYRRFENFGRKGRRLFNFSAGTLLMKQTDTDFKSQIPALPFLAAEIKENPVQIIQCRAQKTKPSKKVSRKSETKSIPNMQLKISLPLENINNLSVLNNNHLMEAVPTENAGLCVTSKNEDSASISTTGNDSESSAVKEAQPTAAGEGTDGGGQRPEETIEWGDAKSKIRRSEVIDKIFSCEICKTYYYSSSQLKMHKLSNRHKLKESSMLEAKENQAEPVAESRAEEPEKGPEMAPFESNAQDEETQNPPPSCTQIENVDADKMNDDTSEMPILEGPFIENPFVRLGMNIMEPPPKPSPPSSVFGFTEDCLKDIQKAIGCTDEEMLILTLLGENSIEIENDILDLDSCKPNVNSNPAPPSTENPDGSNKRDNNNGLHKADFKKRITSALARLVNKAVLNLLQKYKNTNRTGISTEALSFLIKLSKVNNKKNVLELDELLKNESEGETSNRAFAVDDEKKEHTSSPYKYLCTICGSRFEKESTRECHIIRSHKSKPSEHAEEPVPENVATKEHDREEKNIPYKYLCTICGSRFQRESTMECHIIRSHRIKPKKKEDEPPEIVNAVKEDDKKEQNVPYKYLCTICGSRFQKESMWDCHIKRSHNTKGKKNLDELHSAQTTYEEDWSNTWTYDINDELPGSVETPQFLCSDCGINFTSPQEVLDHQKLEHTVQKEQDSYESGPLQSSTIGSSDEILKGKRTPRRGPKHLTKAELDQQRIIANNELRKLDRKPFTKTKCNKVRWGVDAMKFTVEKENKVLNDEDEKEINAEESLKPQVDLKNVDIVPKLNLFRTNNIPEFKVVQKTSCLNRFQRILDNKMKRKSTRSEAKDAEEKLNVDKIFAEPVSVAKKERKRKQAKCTFKKDEAGKVFDVYDFNDSESEPEPMTFSHVKKGGPPQSPTRIKIVKVRDVSETSKNKADSTTNDLEIEDYDSEDSLPLSVVKRTKTEEDEDDVRIADQMEKSEGILEQVEYLIEQLENETNQPKMDGKGKVLDGTEVLKEVAESPKQKRSKIEPKSVADDVTAEDSEESQPETLPLSLDHKYLQLSDIDLKKKSVDDNLLVDDTQGPLSLESCEKTEDSATEKSEDICPVADSSQGISDEEDSLPLVLMSKKSDLTSGDSNHAHGDANKDFGVASELLPVTRQENSFDLLCKNDKAFDIDQNITESPKNSLDDPPSYTEAEDHSERSEKSYDTLNGNVIYLKNDSMSGFDSEISEYGGLDSNVEKVTRSIADNENLIKEVMEKEDVVIVCSKKEQDQSKAVKKKSKQPPKRRKQSVESSTERKKRILPLLSATLEESSFRKSSESPNLKKDEIVKKIWSRRKFCEDVQDGLSDISAVSGESEVKTGNNDDSHIEIDKEIIVKKIWNKKKLETDAENGEVFCTKLGEKSDDIKINKTEVSNEVVIKCGPKAKSATRRRKSRTTSKESSKERIMRKIWSGKCAFQTKAALKTYDSDILLGGNERDVFEEQYPSKKRGRPPHFLNSKKTKLQSDGERSDDGDDLESLLEEIEREEVEKAIRLEFLQLRRSDKANVEMSKDSGNMTLGLFAETCIKQGRDMAERRRKRIKKNVKHPRKNLLKRRKFIKKQSLKPQPQQQSVTKEAEDGEREGTPSLSEDGFKGDAESSNVMLGTNIKNFDIESKIKNRKHKKHRHKHHHHKHKHKKSKHHKYITGKRKIKYKSMEFAKEKPEDMGNFKLLEKMCQDIPVQLEKQSEKRIDIELETLDTKLDEILMSTSSSFESKTKDCDDMLFGDRPPDKDRRYDRDSGNVYEFVEDDSSSLCESQSSRKN